MGIRPREIKPRSPEQNGKVERSHRVNEGEFWRRSIFDRFVPALRARGLGDDQVRTLLVDNPARAFAIGVRRLESPTRA